MVTQDLVENIQKAIDAAIAHQKAVGGKRKLGITGEVGEVLVCKTLGLRLMREDRSEGFDALDAEGKRVQIKTRRSESEGLPRDVGRISTFSRHEFDYALLAILDHDYKLCEIWKAKYEDILPIIEKQKRRNPTLAAYKKVGRIIFPPKQAEIHKNAVRPQKNSKKYRRNTIRGRVKAAWEKVGQPSWSFDQTVKECTKVDEGFAQEELNPAPKFRVTRLEGDTSYVKQWVAGCKFEWLKRSAS